MGASGSPPGPGRRGGSLRASSGKSLERLRSGPELPLVADGEPGGLEPTATRFDEKDISPIKEDLEMQATFVSNLLAFWSNASDWSDGVIPRSSNGLHIQVVPGDSQNAVVNLGTEEVPFVANEITSTDVSLNISGNILTKNLSVLSNDVQGVYLSGDGNLHVCHDLNAGQVYWGSGTLEVGHDLNISFLGLFNSTELGGVVILDHPPKGFSRYGNLSPRGGRDVGARRRKFRFRNYSIQPGQTGLWRGGSVALRKRSLRAKKRIPG